MSCRTIPNRLPDVYETVSTFRVDYQRKAVIGQAERAMHGDSRRNCTKGATPRRKERTNALFSLFTSADTFRHCHSPLACCRSYHALLLFVQQRRTFASIVASSSSSSNMSSPTSVLTSTNKPSAQDQQIRARLLNRLGIYDAPVSVKAQPLTAAQHRRHRILRGMGVGGYTLKPSPPDGSATRNPLDGVIPTKIPLKVDGVPPGRKTTRIAFSEDVEVMPIPTRYEYSDRIKSRIWSNRHELQENAERNALEFASEGWNWRNVTEDDGAFNYRSCVFEWITLYQCQGQSRSPFPLYSHSNLSHAGMYICSQSGELVHPIHLQHLVEEEQEAAEAMDEDEEEETEGTSPPLERGVPVHSAS